jgi:hypothetical protein
MAAMVSTIPMISPPFVLVPVLLLLPSLPVSSQILVLDALFGWPMMTIVGWQFSYGVRDPIMRDNVQFLAHI